MPCPRAYGGAVDLKPFKLLLDVVNAGGVAKAAVLLGVPQSYVSRQIATLERTYGIPLLHRTGRGVTLTDVALELLPRIDALLCKADQLDIELRQGSGVPRGTVRVGLLSSFADTIALRFVEAASRQLPEVRLILFDGSSGLLEEWLATGRIDVGMVVRNQGSQAGDFVLDDAIVLHLVGAAGEPALSRPTISFVEMSELPLVLADSPSGTRPLLDQAARQHGITLRVVLETDSFALQLRLATSGIAFAVTGPYGVRTAIRHGKVQATRLVQPELRRPIGLATTTARPSSFAVRETAHLLRRLMEAATREGGSEPVTPA